MQGKHKVLKGVDFLSKNCITHLHASSDKTIFSGVTCPTLSKKRKGWERKSGVTKRKERAGRKAAH
jgi:hypothetical protein